MVYKQGFKGEDKMKKMKLIMAMFWQIVMALISPIWIGWMYMDITGDGKGYGYDLGGENDISVFFGVMELVLWMIAVVPITVWLCKQFSAIKKTFVAIPIVVFILLFGISVSLIGWSEFISWFGI